jgi:signal transduction histidine kinase
MLIGNLVDNALKYSPTGTPVHVLISVNDGLCALEVADQGGGIPLAERNKVFMKFYRMGNEETRNAQGTGLGLYLVKKIAEQHEAKLQIFDNQPRGTVVKVIFNRINPL